VASRREGGDEFGERVGAQGQVPGVALSDGMDLDADLVGVPVVDAHGEAFARVLKNRLCVLEGVSGRIGDGAEGVHQEGEGGSFLVIDGGRVHGFLVD